MSLNKNSEAKEAFEKAVKMIKTNQSLSKEKQKKFIEIIDKQLAKLNGLDKKGNMDENDAKINESITEEDGQDDLNVLDVNPKYPKAHSSIEIRYEEGRGR